MRLVLLVALALILETSAAPARTLFPAPGARGGSLDRSFGNGGKVLLKIPLAPTALVVQADSSVVVAGVDNSQGLIVRILGNGGIDTSFGSGGIASLPVFGLYSLALQPDGKIVAAGAAPDGSSAELARFTLGGKLDPTFGNGGIVRFSYLAGVTNVALVAVVQPDGRIVVGGFSLPQGTDAFRTSLARFNSDGSPDTSFGSGGAFAQNLVGGVTAIGLQQNGKMLVCGGFVTGAQQIVVRFTANGKLDHHIDGGSLFVTAHTGIGSLASYAFQPDGKVLQWSEINSSQPGAPHVQVARYLRDFSLDPRFAAPPFDFGNNASEFDAPNDAVAGPGGGILVAGWATGASDIGLFGLARLRPGGGLDPTFGHGGRVTTHFVANDAIAKVAVTPDGKIVAAGTDVQGSTTRLAVARYFDD